MRYLDLTLATPEENLALEEALLDSAEDAGGGEILRLWESPRHFAVLGYSCKVRDDLHYERCLKEALPVLRRASGGGTVLQGPGCLNFSLILKISANPSLQNITRTNAWVLEKHREVFGARLGTGVEVEGVSDLTFRSLKFSGNAQRRRRVYLLFHGTILNAFDTALMSRYLTLPPRRPAYRGERGHETFAANIPLATEEIKTLIRKAWPCENTLPDAPLKKMRALLESRYLQSDWHLKY